MIQNFLLKKTLITFLAKKIIALKPLNQNLIDKIWKRKLENNKKKFYLLPKHSVRNDYKYKINKIVSLIKKKGADFQLVTSSENNAWLLNIRGEDAKYSPIPYSYISNR